MLKGEVEHVHADLRQERGADPAGSIVVEELHLCIERVEYLREVRLGVSAEIVLADKADDVIQDEDTLNGRKRLLLQPEPRNRERGDRLQELAALVRVHVHCHEELGVSHQEGGQVKGTAGHCKLDLVPCFPDRRFMLLKPLNHLGAKPILRRIRCSQRSDLGSVVDDLLGKREFVVMPDVLAPESGRLCAHAVLRPESGKEQNIGKLALRFQVGLEPLRVILEVLANRHPRPIRQPGTIDNEPHRQRLDHPTLNYINQC